MKIYKLTFNKYTNALRDTVSDGLHYLTCKGDGYEDGYLMVLTNSFEKVIEEFQKYGDGVKLVKYVGEGFLREYKKDKGKAGNKNIENG